MSFDVVVPTVGRDSLARLLDGLAASSGPPPGRVLLVDDRRDRAAPLLGGRPVPARLAGRVRVVAGRAAGPAAARNLGWRAARASWVAFLDDDVVPSPGWLGDLAADLGGLGAEVAGSQGRVRVPLPEGRRPTDWERNVRGLETARWATADMAYRRVVLAEVGGFDERFPRAYREDADLALRVLGAGYRLVAGRRGVTHPVRAAGPLVSVRLQAGNADDVLMRAVHGPGWRGRAGVPRGRRPRHLLVTGVGLVGVGAGLLARRGVPSGGLALPPGTTVGRAETPRRSPTTRWARRAAVVAGLGWLAGTVELTLARVLPGPRSRREILAMVGTSVVLPPVATWRWVAGWARLPRLLADGERAPRPDRPGGGLPHPPRAVLFDRDGTLVVDVPYNGDPERVVVMPGAREAVARLRAAGVPTAVVSNQSGVARGLIGAEQVEAVNRRVEELVGPLGPWLVCLHGPGDGCGCRKPAPGLVVEAAAALGVEPRDCVVIGDVGADVGAARAAGARSVLVPTAATRAEEVAAAPQVAADLLAAVELLLGPDGDGVPPGRGAG
jgi:histidinol-phosphate phosphatase family protein